MSRRCWPRRASTDGRRAKTHRKLLRGPCPFPPRGPASENHRLMALQSPLPHFEFYRARFFSFFFPHFFLLDQVNKSFFLIVVFWWGSKFQNGGRMVFIMFLFYVTHTVLHPEPWRPQQNSPGHLLGED